MVRCLMRVTKGITKSEVATLSLYLSCSCWWWFSGGTEIWAVGVVQVNFQIRLTYFLYDENPQEGGESSSSSFENLGRKGSMRSWRVCSD